MAIGWMDNLDEADTFFKTRLNNSAFADLDGDIKSTVSGTTYSDDYEEDKNVGIFIGADLMITDSIAISVEGRFADEEAVNVGAVIRF